MNLWQNYHIADSVEDALHTLVSAPDEACFIGGGTDLLLDLQQGRQSPIHTLIDITEIPELKSLEIRLGELFIGAGISHRKILNSSLVQEHADALIEACGLIGGPQVRNTATLGGNVAHALPAADGTIALMALNAEIEIAGLTKRDRAPLTNMFLGPGKNSLEDELLVGFYLPTKKPGDASAFRRVMRPQGVAIAILNLGVWLHRDGNLIADVRIAVGPSGPVPIRMTQAEEALRGNPLTDEFISKATECILDQASFRTSRHRATSTYRQHVVGVLLQDTLSAAFKRAENATG
jgi:carbon-monoxide dehydrogenase medium subunit